jgi:hypothetical protein
MKKNCSIDYLKFCWCIFLFLQKIQFMELVFATNNLHKLEELQAILGTGFELLSLKDIGCSMKKFLKNSQR